MYRRIGSCNRWRCDFKECGAVDVLVNNAGISMIAACGRNDGGSVGKK